AAASVPLWALAWLVAPRVTRISSPWRSMSYGIILSRLSTSRERFLPSAARMELRPPDCTSMRREGSASVVSGRSIAIRAGLSMVKESGCGTVPERCSVSLVRSFGIGCTSIDCSVAPSAAYAGRLGSVANQAAALRIRYIGETDFIVRDSLLAEAQGRRPFHVATEPVGDDLGEVDSGGRDVGDPAIVLAHVVADRDAMDDAVLRLHQAVGRALDVESAHHLQRIERELLQELPRALGIQLHGVESARLARHERGAQALIVVDEGLVRLDLRQRLDAAARLLLGLPDELLQVAVRARAARQPDDGGAGEEPGANRYVFSHVSDHPVRPLASAPRRMGELLLADLLRGHLIRIEIPIGLGGEGQCQIVITPALVGGGRLDVDVTQRHDPRQGGDAADELAELVIAAGEHHLDGQLRVEVLGLLGLGLEELLLQSGRERGLRDVDQQVRHLGPAGELAQQRAEGALQVLQLRLVDGEIDRLCML